MRTQHKTSLSKHLRLVSDSLHPRLQQQLCGLERMTAQLSCDQLGQFKRNTRAISTGPHPRRVKLDQKYL